MRKLTNAVAGEDDNNNKTIEFCFNKNLRMGFM